MTRVGEIEDLVRDLPQVRHVRAGGPRSADDRPSPEFGPPGGPRSADDRPSPEFGPPGGPRSADDRPSPEFGPPGGAPRARGEGGCDGKGRAESTCGATRCLALAASTAARSILAGTPTSSRRT